MGQLLILYAEDLQIYNRKKTNDKMIIAGDWQLHWFTTWIQAIQGISVLNNIYSLSSKTYP